MPHQPSLPSPVPRRAFRFAILLGGPALLGAALLAPFAPQPLRWALVGLALLSLALLLRRFVIRLRLADQALAERTTAHAALARRIQDLEQTVEAQRAELAANADVAAALGRQLAYSQALARCSQALLSQDYAAVDLQSPLAEALEVLREALAVDRFYIYVNSGPPDDPLLDAIVRTHPEQIIWQNFPQSLPLRIIAPSVRAALGRGEPVGGPITEIIIGAPDVVQTLHASGLHNVQIVPIHQEGHWWGSLAAGGLRGAQSWGAPEVQLLRTTAEMIAAFVRSWHAANQLREREEMLRAIGDNLPLGVIYRMVQNPDGSHTVQYVSAGIERLYGISPAQLYADASTIRRIWHPEDVERVLALDEEALANPGTFELEARHMRNPEGPRWIYLRSTPTPLAGGQVRWDGIALDVTARRAAEEALNESRQQLQQAMWAADLALWGWDARTDTTTISPEMPALLGYDPAAIGDPVAFWITNVHPEDRAAIGQMIQQCRSGAAEIFEASYRMRHHDGTWRWMRSRGRTVAHDETGHPLRAIGITHDITAQKQAEQEIRTQRDFAQQVITLIGQGLVVLDPESRITHISPSFTRILGYQPDEIVGQFADLIIPPDMDAQQTLEHERRKQGQTSTYELQLLHKNGSRVDLLVTAAPIVRDGAFQGTISVLTDISARKRAEAELRQAKEAAEAADRAKSRFLAHMSHEIRTPLNAVIGMASLLQETPLNADQRELLATIRTGGETLLDIINHILDLSKIESGQLDLTEHPFDLQLCVEEALNLVTLQAAQKHLTLQLEIDPATPTLVIGDELRLRQVLVNLLANAIKFTEQGGVTLRITRPDADGSRQLRASQRRQDETGANHHGTTEDFILQPSAFILFEVRDTGVGIAPDQLERIFEPFAQAGVNATERIGGTGLGLTISRQLVDAMGGMLHASSALGQGSTFSVVLPLRAAPGDTARAGHRPILVGRRVLLVAGPGIERDRLESICRGWGMQPILVDSGQAALAQLASDLAFDLAVIALTEPDQISLLTARLLEDHHAWAQRPLVLVTDQPQPAAEDATPRSRMAVTRPVRRTRFAAALADLLSTASVEATSGIGDLRVLLAEDNLVNQQVTVRLLRQLQIHPDLATDGLQAVEAVQRAPYDLVLMDAQMPVLDGLQATAQIRALGDAITQPQIVALTALALIADREQFLAAGADDYLSKPVQMDDLRASLTRLRGPHDPACSRATQADDTAAVAESTVIDWGVLDQLSEALGAEGSATITQLVALFHQEIAGQIDQLDAAIQHGASAQIAQIAHRLCGSSRQMGATQMAGLTFALEQAALRQEHAALPALAANLRAAYGQAIQELSRRYGAGG